jgi:hypothetical protein
VTADAARHALHEQMHWSCFHDEFEHDGGPDTPCADPSCPARLAHPSPPPTRLDGLP